jgi:DNA helicase-2/ATP-dependent DNA helicase PcrA
MASNSYREAVNQLNAKQREAFDEPGNTVLLAGPGSGKTATLVLKVARLLDEIRPPRGLACLTYSNEAAGEFKHRLRELGIRSGGRLFTGTVHGFCLAHILRPFASRLQPDRHFLATCEIANDENTREARAKGLSQAGINEPEIWWKSKLDAYRRLALVDPAFAEGLDERLPRVSEGYADHLRTIERIDFDDIVLGSLDLVRRDEHVRSALSAKYPWFVIDEYQDLGLALHSIVQVLIDQAGVKVFAVGDPDQSIYAFSGARPEFLDEVAKRDDVHSVRLAMNYRCRQRIIDASLHILQPQQERGFRSAADGADSRGEVIFKFCKTGLEEQAAYVVAKARECIDAGMSPGEIGILARRWDDLGPCERALSAAHIPYRIARTREYRPTPLTAWVEEMVLWCAGGWRLGKPRMSDLFSAWARMSSACSGVSSSSVDLPGRVTLYKALSAVRDPDMRVADWVVAMDSALGIRAIVSHIDSIPIRMRYDLRELGNMLGSLTTGSVAVQTLAEFAGIDRNKVVLQSLHSSKGLEYTFVFMLALEKGILPQYMESESEARRLFYVGMTRTRREVHLLYSGHFKNAKGKVQEWGPSPFLPELWKRLHPET